jgi:hypothetical protein
LEVKFEEREGYPTKVLVHAKVEPLKAKKETPTNGKGKIDTQPMHNHDIKCFSCLSSGHIAYQYPNKEIGSNQLGIKESGAIGAISLLSTVRSCCICL